MKSFKRQKVGHITEEGMSNLLHRYSAQKVLTLLQEMSQSADSKMDWNAMVKKTATGITSAREYQSLWRHIAYCEEIRETVNDGSALDDDSDLEFELEAYPPVSSEASAEAAACVKVLVGDSRVSNISTVEAPLTINVPHWQIAKSRLEKSQPASMQGKNITVPVSVKKQPGLQGSGHRQLGPAEKIGNGSEANGLTSTVRKRKSIPWTDEDDLALRAGVEKSGGKNWASILKEHFKGDRSAKQLSLRWSFLTKRDSNRENNRESNPTTVVPSSGAQCSSAQMLATNSALRMSLKDNNFNKLTVCNGAASIINHGKVSTSNEHKTVVINALPHSNPVGGNPISSKPGTSSSTINPQVLQKKAPSNPLQNSVSSMMTKAAVAAGARIATPLEQLKAAQANNIVHIMPNGNSTVVKNSVTSTSNPRPSTHLGPNRAMPFGSQPVRANLLGPTSSSVPISHANGSQPLRATFARPVVLPAPSHKVSTSSVLRNNIRPPLPQPSQGVAAIRPCSQTSVAVCLPKEVEVKKVEKTSDEITKTQN